jgi:hypothetical protein
LGSGTASVAVAISGTVAPRPCGYCSVSSTGTCSRCAARRSVRALRRVRAGACMAGTSRSCMSITARTESSARMSITRNSLCKASVCSDREVRKAFLLPVYCHENVRSGAAGSTRHAAGAGGARLGARRRNAMGKSIRGSRRSRSSGGAVPSICPRYSRNPAPMLDHAGRAPFRKGLPGWNPWFMVYHASLVPNFEK